jgi:hypothetical protein
MILAWAVPMMVLMYGIEKLLQATEASAFDWRKQVDDVVIG